MDDQIKSGSSHRGLPAEDECLVCFGKMTHGTFGHLLWEGERARFCSQECFEIFQNSPSSFMKRLKARAGKLPDVVAEDQSNRSVAGDTIAH